jgi:hypothetical protein
MNCTGKGADGSIKDTCEKLHELEIFTLDETIYPGYRIICKKVNTSLSTNV